MIDLKYALDVDNVLTDWVRGFFDYLDVPYREVTEWDDPFVRDNFHLIEKDEKFWLNLPILSHPKDIKFDVDCYITARSIPSEITMEWLYGKGFPVAPVFSVGVKECGTHHSKTDVIKDRKIDIFVDDHVKHWQEINNNTDCVCFLMDAPHNQEEWTSLRISNLSEIGRWKRVENFNKILM